eukprot:361975-Chlamydomonas_euryale.AAC.4
MSLPDSARCWCPSCADQLTTPREGGAAAVAEGGGGVKGRGCHVEPVGHREACPEAAVPSRTCAGQQTGLDLVVELRLFASVDSHPSEVRFSNSFSFLRLKLTLKR